MDTITIPATTIILTALLLFYVYRVVFSRKQSEKIASISHLIEVGTSAYLNRQLRVIAPFIPIIAAAIYFLLGWRAAVSFTFGAILSQIAAYGVMRLVVKVHGRVAEDAKTDGTQAFHTAFLGGSIMGLSIPAISLLGLTVLYIVFGNPQDLVGFGFGASLTALFAQIGGGIYTKGADIGADLVGKLELGIPEDDPRNPAVIADLVGDNVGDCAGRGADLFESFSGDVITGMILGAAFIPVYGPGALVYPLILQCIGNLASLVGILLVKQLKSKPERAIEIGLAVTSILGILGAYYLTVTLLGDIRILYAALSGMAAVLVGIYVAQYFTGFTGKPVLKIADASQRGAGLTLITGLSYGLMSPIIPVIAVVSAAAFSFIVSGGSLFAVAIANIGTDLMVGFIMSADAFGPIVDNADGVSEMAGNIEAGDNLAILDAVGNSMKAYTKALSMTTGALTAFSIIVTYVQVAGIRSLDLLNLFNIGALFIGVSLSFLIAALLIGSTAKTAEAMVDEVRRQYAEHPEIMRGEMEPDYAKCIDISTRNALREITAPAALGVIPPILIAFIFGPETLVAFLIGITISCVSLAVFFNNVGAAWDNAKKVIERGLYGGKGSNAHKAAVIGDTVGDPLKDVAGPSLIIFMKLVGMTALLLLPILVK
jgi:K(+)-stimulated pyrophosphate-energized sodium pump